ncbi:hypothetical protein ACTXT7_006345 [Hymenolepis weldensis]
MEMADLLVVGESIITSDSSECESVTHALEIVFSWNKASHHIDSQSRTALDIEAGFDVELKWYTIND